MEPTACPLISQWKSLAAVIYVPNSSMNPASQFPFGHVSARAVDTTHIPASSCVCLVIIAWPHQRGTSAQCTCLPAKCGETTARGRREMSGATAPIHPPKHGLQKFKGANHLTPPSLHSERICHRKGKMTKKNISSVFLWKSCLVVTCQELWQG